MRTLVALAACATLVGCGSVDRSAGPKFSAVSSKPMMDAAACIVREGDSRWIDRTGLSKTVTHQIVTRQPGAIVEVQPMQALVVGEEIYFARISAVDGGKSRMEVFGLHSWGDRMIEAVRACR